MKAQKAAKPIALIKTGTTIPQIMPEHGDFEDWFAEAMNDNDLLQTDVFRHQALPPVEDLAGIVITGSPYMVSEREAWSEYTADWLAEAVGKGLPVLGICYGHQLLAHALGGRVGPNPSGRQIGTVTAQFLESSEKDPLLGHLTRSLATQTSHSEVVLELPAGAERLATSPLDDNFAIRFAPRAWGLQFHPEFSRSVMSEYIRLRSEALLAEGLNPDQLQQTTTETEEAKSVLSKFVSMVRQNWA